MMHPRRSAKVFQPTLPARGATFAICYLHQPQSISTHAPRTGSDVALNCWNCCIICYFNPRSPHGERPQIKDVAKKLSLFQPTLPARGATYFPLSTPHIDYFNPRSPHGERLRQCYPYRWKTPISTHAPRTGSDSSRVDTLSLETQFQPTLPARGATRWQCAMLVSAADFNPRSPHGERRRIAELEADTQKYFNPRSPHGERHLAERSAYGISLFQPTLPARGATARA